MDVSIKGTKPRVCSHVCLWAFHLVLLWVVFIEEGLWEGKGSNVKPVQGLDYWAVSISSAAVVWFTPCDSWACSCPIYVEAHHSCEAARSAGAKLIPHIRNQGCSAACLGLIPNIILLHCTQQSFGDQRREQMLAAMLSPLCFFYSHFCRQLPSKFVNLDQFFVAIAFANKAFLSSSDQSKLVPLFIAERN